MAAHVSPYWQWCVMPGASRTSTLRVDQTDYGDGYVYRLTRGLNPVIPSWNIAVPFVGLAELSAYDAFLQANAARGFWFTPPDATADVFVYADAWSASITDRNQSDVVGTLQATFTRCFNPQPLNPT